MVSLRRAIINDRTKVEIYCKKCNETFFQTPNTHLQGKGCPKCIGRNKTTEQFIFQSKEIHKEKYGYDKTIYVNCSTMVQIFCKKCKQYFLQKPVKHLSGRGCQKCKQSKKEIIISDFLEENNSIFLRQKRFSDCKNEIPLPFDFAIYDDKNNLQFLIEFQGSQHYHEWNFGSKDKNNKRHNSIENVKYRDKIKVDYCAKNNIPLLSIKYTIADPIQEIKNFAEENNFILSYPNYKPVLPS